MANMQFLLEGNAAQLYEKYSVPMGAKPAAERLLANVRLTKSDRVLDAACGTGIVTRLIAERPQSVAGIVGVDMQEVGFTRRLPATEGVVMELVARTAIARDVDAASEDCAPRHRAGSVRRHATVSQRRRLCRADEQPPGAGKKSSLARTTAMSAPLERGSCVASTVIPSRCLSALRFHYSTFRYRVSLTWFLVIDCSVMGDQ